MGKHFVFLLSNESPREEDFDWPRTVGKQLENGGFPFLGSPVKLYISKS